MENLKATDLFKTMDMESLVSCLKAGLRSQNGIMVKLAISELEERKFIKPVWQEMFLEVLEPGLNLGSSFAVILKGALPKTAGFGILAKEMDAQMTTGEKELNLSSYFQKLLTEKKAVAMEQLRIALALKLVNVTKAIIKALGICADAKDMAVYFDYYMSGLTKKDVDTGFMQIIGGSLAEVLRTFPVGEYENYIKTIRDYALTVSFGGYIPYKEYLGKYTKISTPLSA